jgi:hypothetical protein
VTPAQRQEIEERLTASTARAVELFETHSATALARRPASASWSAAECVVHLTLTAAAAVPVLEAAVADLRSGGRVTDSPSRMDWLGRLLTWSLEPPPRLRTRTAAPFEPGSIEPVERVRLDFLAQQDLLVAVLRASEGLDLTRARVTSPFDRRVRYNAFSMLRILETHERRHLWQAEAAIA